MAAAPADMNVQQMLLWVMNEVRSQRDENNQRHEDSRREFKEEIKILRDESNRHYEKSDQRHEESSKRHEALLKRFDNLDKRLSFLNVFMVVIIFTSWNPESPLVKGLLTFFGVR